MRYNGNTSEQEITLSGSNGKHWSWSSNQFVSYCARRKGFRIGNYRPSSKYFPKGRPSRSGIKANEKLKILNEVFSD
jgi:hypothetical protein